MRIYMHTGAEHGAAFYIDTEDGGVHVVPGRHAGEDLFGAAQAVNVLRAAVRIKEPTVRAEAIKAVSGFVQEELRKHVPGGSVFVVG
jgi:hypothetical protein